MKNLSLALTLCLLVTSSSIFTMSSHLAEHFVALIKVEPNQALKELQNLTLDQISFLVMPKDKKGKNLLHHAAKSASKNKVANKDSAQLILFLLASGADQWALDNKGYYPYEYVPQASNIYELLKFDEKIINILENYEGAFSISLLDLLARDLKLFFEKTYKKLNHR